MILVVVTHTHTHTHTHTAKLQPDVTRASLWRDLRRTSRGNTGNMAVMDQQDAQEGHTV